MKPPVMYDAKAEVEVLAALGTFNTHISVNKLVMYYILNYALCVTRRA
jgi:hypothetical protein